MTLPLNRSACMPKGFFISHGAMPHTPEVSPAGSAVLNDQLVAGMHAHVVIQMSNLCTLRVYGLLPLAHVVLRSKEATCAAPKLHFCVDAGVHCLTDEYDLELQKSLFIAPAQPRLIVPNARTSEMLLPPWFRNT